MASHFYGCGDVYLKLLYTKTVCDTSHNELVSSHCDRSYVCEDWTSMWNSQNLKRIPVISAPFWHIREVVWLSFVYVSHYKRYEDGAQGKVLLWIFFDKTYTHKEPPSECDGAWSRSPFVWIAFRTWYIQTLSPWSAYVDELSGPGCVWRPHHILYMWRMSPLLLTTACQTVYSQSLSPHHWHWSRSLVLVSYTVQLLGPCHFEACQNLWRYGLHRGVPPLGKTLSVSRHVENRNMGSPLVSTSCTVQSIGRC